MQRVTLLCAGRLKEPFYRDAAGEYQKRLAAFCRFEAIEIPEQRLSEAPSPQEIAAALDREAAELAKHIPAGSTLCAFCVEGKRMDSPAFARWLGTQSRVCFLIGGSNGLSEALKRRADLRLSVSDMTFPHHLFRVMALEQIYRGFMIGAGRKYHK